MSANLFFGEIANPQIDFLAGNRKALQSFLDGRPPEVSMSWIDRLLGKQSRPLPPAWPASPIKAVDLNWGPDCLHYVLNGTSAPVVGVPNLMHGSNVPTMFIGDVGYGGASAYYSQHASELLEHLEGIPEGVLRERFHAGGFGDGEADSDQAWELLVEDIASLVSLLTHARKGNNGVFWYVA